jgi:hypothetical protein
MRLADILVACILSLSAAAAETEFSGLWAERPSDCNNRLDDVGPHATDDPSRIAWRFTSKSYENAVERCDFHSLGAAKTGWRLSGECNGEAGRRRLDASLVLGHDQLFLRDLRASLPARRFYRCGLR